ncbi:MAG: guanylate kinase [Alphaproteobacteria bacterium]|nr:MAG: guanylate kinase [Alphaproteobacteria bacterium]
MGKIKKEGVLLVISSPSGTGKTTICKKLLEYDKNIHLSVSVTTRKKRKNEVEGVDYYFKSKKDFLNLKSQNSFIENAFVFENYYGTLKLEVLEQLENGIDVLIDIDWQGTRQITQAMKGNLIKVFLLPPSIDELKKRLSKRNSDSTKEINFRMSKALKEIKHFDEYDYVLVNDNLDNTFQKIVKILEVERLKLPKQLYISDYVKKLNLT